MGLPQAQKFARIREHITMLGRHYATGHPSVNPKFKSAQEEQELRQKYNDVIAFASWYENNFEKILFANPPNGRDLFESYLWVWETIYTDDQAREGLRKFREVTEKFKNIAAAQRKKFNKLNLPLNPTLLKLETKILQGRTAALLRQAGGDTEIPDFGTDARAPQVVYCDDCGKPIEDLSKSKRCNKCGRVFHVQDYGEKCGFGWSSGSECRFCIEEKNRKATKRNGCGMAIGGFFEILFGIGAFIIGMPFVVGGILVILGIIMIIIGLSSK